MIAWVVKNNTAACLQRNEMLLPHGCGRQLLSVDGAILGTQASFQMQHQQYIRQMAAILYTVFHVSLALRKHKA